MSEQYPGGFINKTAPTLNPALGNAAPGVWNMTQVQQAIKAGTWPAYDPYYKNVVLNLHGDGTNGAQNNTFLDSSTNNFPITRNGNTTQGTFTPYGSNWSNYFVRSSSQYLTVSNSGGQFSFGTGAFTIECWINLSSLPSSTGYPASYWMFGGGPANSNPGIDFYINNTQIGFNLTDFTSPTAIGNHGMSVGTWYHVAVVRGGGSNQTVSIYVNGTRVATASSVTATADAATTGIAISAAEPSGATGGNFNGYISNHRIVKGTAVYDPTQSSLTVPTAPLTAITNTQLLTCQSNRFIDNSSNALSITTSGSPSVQRFSPFSPTTAYSTSVIGGSGYFDGSGDYLTSPSNAAFDFGTGNFTIEAWGYRTSAGAYGFVISRRAADANYGPFSLGLDGSNVPYFACSSSGSSWIFVLNGSALPLNSWFHLAGVRNGTTFALYVNGTSVATTTSSASLMASSVTPVIGAHANGSEPFAGYISNARISNTAVYTSSFTPSTSPLTAISGTQLLYNFTNAGIFDNAMMNDLETLGNAQISTSVKKYGSGSISMTSSGDYLKGTQPSVVYDINGGDFTIEFWVNFTSLAADRALISKYGNSAETAGGLGYVVQWVQSSAVLRLVLGVGSGSDALYTWSWSPSTSTWYHVAITRSGTSGRAFVNGTQIGTTSTLSTSDVASPNVIQIGKTHTVAQYLLGYMDDVRITKGYARYTANFTAPTSQLQDQ